MCKSRNEWVQGILTHCLCSLEEKDDLNSAIEKVRVQEVINLEKKYPDLHKYDAFQRGIQTRGGSGTFRVAYRQ